jgi:RimJ/RimL family protein N-acetyltransferase
VTFKQKIQQIRSNVYTGKTIDLYPYTMEYLEEILHLRNQSAVKYLLAQHSEITREQQVEWIKSYEKKDDEFGFIIKNKRNEVVGVTFCYNYDRHSMEMGRTTFDTAKLMGRPYAIEACSMIVDLVFDFLGLEMLNSTVKSDNYRLLKFLSRLNWTIAGDCIIRGNLYKIMTVKPGQCTHHSFAHLFDRMQNNMIA